MSEHTPGPWYVSCPPRPFLATVIDEAEAELAYILYPGDLFAREDEARANARLMALAPDLLKACENSLALFRDMLGDCDEDCECIIHDLEQVIAGVRS